MEQGACFARGYVYFYVSRIYAARIAATCAAVQGNYSFVTYCGLGNSRCRRCPRASVRAVLDVETFYTLSFLNILLQGYVVKRFDAAEVERNRGGSGVIVCCPVRILAAVVQIRCHISSVFSRLACSGCRNGCRFCEIRSKARGHHLAEFFEHFHVCIGQYAGLVRRKVKNKSRVSAHCFHIHLE